jgi:hypothetical protein
MKNLENNSYFRHINREDWGVGKLVKSDKDYLEMYFANIGYRRLTRLNAESLLESLEEETAEKEFRKGAVVCSKSGEFKQEVPRLSASNSFQNASDNPCLAFEDEEGSPLVDLSEHVPQGHMTKRYK